MSFDKDNDNDDKSSKSGGGSFKRRLVGEFVTVFNGDWRNWTAGGLKHFFFPSFASAALARSSHSVALMNELAKCMKQRPSLRSQKRSADHYAVRSLVRPISEKQHKPNKPKSEQNTQRNRHRSKDSSVAAGNLCANELRDTFVLWAVPATK